MVVVVDGASVTADGSGVVFGKVVGFGFLALGGSSVVITITARPRVLVVGAFVSAPA
jgi:hypothetical protein